MRITNIQDLGLAFGVLREKKTGVDYLIPVMKRLLGHLHVPYVDICCPNEFGPLPVSFNTVSQTLQYFSYITNSWVNTPAVISSRFGIEDNLGIQNRSINMQQYSLTINNSSGIYLQYLTNNNLIDHGFTINNSGSAIYSNESGNLTTLNILSNLGGATLKTIIGSVTKIQTFSSGEGYIPLMVNNIPADSTGNITLNLGTIPGLQAVTDVGNTTTNSIIVTSIGSVIATANGGNNAALHSDPVRGGYIQITKGLGNDAQIFSENLTILRQLQLPNNSGILALSVNGTFADTTGNITIATGGGGTALNTIIVQCDIGSAYTITGSSNVVTGLTTGSTTIQCTDFANVRLLIFINNILVRDALPPGGEIYYTKPLLSNSITLSTPLNTTDYIYIQTIPK